MKNRVMWLMLMVVAGFCSCAWASWPWDGCTPNNDVNFTFNLDFQSNSTATRTWTSMPGGINSLYADVWGNHNDHFHIQVHPNTTFKESENG